MIDREGVEIGVCTAVLADEATGRPEWMHARLDDATVVVPLLDATEVDGRVRVSVDRAKVAAAPPVGDDQQLSEAQEIELYQHFGIEFSRETSDSLLPAPGAEPPAPGAGSGAGAAGDRAPSSPSGQSSGGGSQVAAAVGAVAGLTAVLAVVLRRVWKGRLAARRPPTRSERAARRAREASAAARTQAEHLATAAAPLAAGAGKVLQKGARAGAVSARRAAGAGAVSARKAAGAGAEGAAAAGSWATGALALVAQQVAHVVLGGARAGFRLGGAVESVTDAVSEGGERVQKGWHKLVSRVALVLGFGTGYVLGARAGQERFRQIKQSATEAVARLRDRWAPAATGGATAPDTAHVPASDNLGG